MYSILIHWVTSFILFNAYETQCPHISTLVMSCFCFRKGILGIRNVTERELYIIREEVRTTTHSVNSSKC